MMVIESVEVLKLDLPMKTSFETSFGKLTTKSTVLVKITSDGVTGYGEAASFHAPLYNPETVDTCVYIIKKFIAPSILKKDFKSPEELRAAYDYIVGHNIAKAGVENAFWHLLAQSGNTSLKELFGGTRSSIQVGASIGIQPTIKSTLTEVEDSLEKGYGRIKLKTKPGWDLKVLKEVRKIWPDIDLMVDGNSAYKLQRDLKTLIKFDEYNLMMIEQPLQEDDIIDHSTLQKLINTPICLDESITSVDKARKAISIGACKIINIKPVRVGGALETIAIHDLCMENGVGVWCGGMLETGIGRAFNIALASKENFIYPSDMSPFDEFYSEDLVSDSHKVTSDGHVKVRTNPGLGYKINDKVIKEHTTESYLLE
jgi:O-succinylbenzoate synthase